MFATNLASWADCWELTAVGFEGELVFSIAAWFGTLWFSTLVPLRRLVEDDDDDDVEVEDFEDEDDDEEDPPPALLSA